MKKKHLKKQVKKTLKSFNFWFILISALSYLTPFVLSYYHIKNIQKIYKNIANEVQINSVEVGSQQVLVTSEGSLVSETYKLINENTTVENPNISDGAVQQQVINDLKLKPTSYNLNLTTQLQNIEVTVGDSVSFTNTSENEVQIILQQSNDFSVKLPSNFTYTQTYFRPGEYLYISLPQNNQVLKVTVKKPPQIF